MNELFEAILLLLLLAIIVTYDCAYISGTLNTGGKFAEALTEERVKTAYDMTRNTDDTYKQCDDFWLYSCGNYMKVHRSLDSKQPVRETNLKAEMQRITDEKVTRLLEGPNTQSTIEPVKMVKKLYSSCITQAKGARTVKPYLDYIFNKLRSMPIITNHVSILRTYLRLTGQLPWFKYYIWQDFKNVGKTISLKLNYSLNIQSSYDDVATIKYMFPSFVRLESIMKFYRQISEMTQTRYVRKDDDSLRVKHYTSDELSKLLRGFDLVSIFDDILYVANETVNKFTFTTADTEILKWFSNLIIETDKNDFLIIAFLEIYKSVYKRFPSNERQCEESSGPKSNLSSIRLQKKYCLDVCHLAGDVLGWMYSEKHFDKQMQDDANSIVDYLFSATKVVLSETNWLDKWSIHSALVNLEVLRRRISIDPYQSEYIKEELIKNYAMNIVNKMDVRAVYNILSNSIHVPLTLMQSPIFRKNAHMVVKFGGLGALIGHTLFHVFDIDDENYINGRWLSEESLYRYKELRRSVVNTYSQYEIESQSTNVNGKQLSNENIADIGGLKIAYKAYLLWKSEHSGTDKYLPRMNMTDLQLFFFAFAQSWCSSEKPKPDKSSYLGNKYAPNEARVQVSLQNSKEFAEVFKCPNGTKMNPENKIEFWGIIKKYMDQRIFGIRNVGGL